MDTVTDTVLAAVMEQLGFKSPAPQPGSIGSRYSFLPFKYWGLCYSNGKFWLFGNCRENETGFNTPPNVFNALAA
jgi:hypothetical protein